MYNINSLIIKEEFTKTDFYSHLCRDFWFPKEDVVEIHSAGGGGLDSILMSK